MKVGFVNYVRVPYRISPRPFQDPDKRQSRLCIKKEGSVQQQSNIPVGFAKYQED